MTGLEKDKLGDWNTLDCRHGLGKSTCYSIFPSPIKYVSPHQHFLGSAAVLFLLFQLYCRALTSLFQFSHTILHKLTRTPLVTGTSSQNACQPHRSFARKGHKVSPK